VKIKEQSTSMHIELSTKTALQEGKINFVFVELIKKFGMLQVSLLFSKKY
jgi:hypothetical protein